MPDLMTVIYKYFTFFVVDFFVWASWRIDYLLFQYTILGFRPLPITRK